LDDYFAALVRGPSTTYPRGFPLLFPAWFAAAFAGVWIAWLKVIGPMQWWYAGTLTGGLLLAGITAAAVFATIRQPAFRADRNGIRLGLRAERKRPRNRQAHLWWSDVRQLRIEPRRYGVMVEISLGPAARIVRRRGPARQALLWAGTLVMPFGLGRGTPRLTEPRRKDPQYRVRLYDVTPEELGLALASLALPAVEIIVISRRYGPIMARRPQPTAPRPAAPPATAALPKAPRMGPLPATAPAATAPRATAPPATAAPAPAVPGPAPLVTATPAPATPVAATPVAGTPVAGTPAPATARLATPRPVIATPPEVPRPAVLPEAAPMAADLAEADLAETGTTKADLAEPDLAEADLAEPGTAGAEPAAAEPAEAGPTAADTRPDYAALDDTLLTGPDSGEPADDDGRAEVPVMVGPHADREVGAGAEREAAQPAA
jgi:hypothetical protein